MAKAKGATKTGGRKKGTPNKITGDLRAFVSGLLDANRTQIQKDLRSEEITPYQRLVFLEKLMAYVIPKQNANNSTISFGQMSEEQIDRVISELNDPTNTTAE